MGRPPSSPRTSPKIRRTRAPGKQVTRPDTADAVELVRRICSLAGSRALTAGTNGRRVEQVRDAIQQRDTPFLYEHLVESLSFQGVSDSVAFTYMARHGRVRWRDVEQRTNGTTVCPL